MTRKAKRIILIVAVVQLVLTVAIFALPRVVEALPGRYLVRLQNLPIAGDMIELVSTPIAAALPVAAGAPSNDPDPASIPVIPGLEEEVMATRTRPTATPTSTGTPPPTPAVEPVETEVPPTQTPVPSPTPEPTPIPERIVLDGLITVRQGFNNCGPANMTIVLNYYGEETTQQQAAEYLKPNEEDRNVSPWQISDYVNEFTGLRSTVHSGGDIELVKRYVAAGFPVVIEKGYEPQQGAEGWYGHYLTVYGYDEAKEEFYSRDTYLGPFDGSPRVDSYEEFAKWWQHFNYTFYVVYPAFEEERVLSMMPDVLEDEVSMWEYTAELARREMEEQPDNVFTHFNLGVSLTRLGQVVGDPDYYEQATVAFDQARSIGLPPRTLYYEHRPLMAYYRTGRIDDVLELTAAMLDTPGGRYVEEIFWYRGHGLAAQGDLLGARENYQSALEVNPNFYPAQISLDWVNSELEG